MSEPKEPRAVLVDEAPTVIPLIPLAGVSSGADGCDDGICAVPALPGGEEPHTEQADPEPPAGDAGESAGPGADSG